MKTFGSFSSIQQTCQSKYMDLHQMKPSLVNSLKKNKVLKPIAIMKNSLHSMVTRKRSLMASQQQKIGLLSKGTPNPPSNDVKDNTQYCHKSFPQRQCFLKTDGELAQLYKQKIENNCSISLKELIRSSKLTSYQSEKIVNPRRSCQTVQIKSRKQKTNFNIRSQSSFKREKEIPYEIAPWMSVEDPGLDSNLHNDC